MSTDTILAVNAQEQRARCTCCNAQRHCLVELYLAGSDGTLYYFCDLDCMAAWLTLRRMAATTMPFVRPLP